jgi:hypothetical protein
MKETIRQIMTVLCLLAVSNAVMAQAIDSQRADVNADGKVDVADITSVMTVMANGGYTEPISTGSAPAGVQAVDLGLPSGTKWANMNVGASRAGDYGQYFAWGETKGYGSSSYDGRSFDWASYKWMKSGQSSYQQINKYQAPDGQNSSCWYNSDRKYVGDKKLTLEPSDDAATVNWGEMWCIPSYYQMVELIEWCSFDWTSQDGHYGWKLTSRVNGNYIFLPAAGRRLYTSQEDQNLGGYYWSSTLYAQRSYYARRLNFDSGNAKTDGDNRCYGFTVRPVLK